MTRFVLGTEWLEGRLLLSGAPGDSQSDQPAVPPGRATAAEQGALDGGQGRYSNAGEQVDETLTDVSGSPMRPIASGPTRNAYVVVPESPEPHTTLDSAQALPDIPFFGVVGTLRGSDSVDLFRLNIDPQLPNLRLNVWLSSPAGFAETVWLLDGNGDVLAKQPVGTHTQASVQSVLLTLENARGIAFVGISGTSDGDVAPDTDPVAFQIWVAREGTIASPPQATAMVPVGPVIPVATGASPQVNADASATATTVSAHLLDPSATATAPRLVASAVLPALSAGPSGGVIDVGDPTRPLVAHTAHPAGSDLVEGHIDPPKANAEGPPRADADPAVDIEETSAVLVLKGPGGLPLQVTALTGDWPGQVAVMNRSTGHGECSSAAAGSCTSHTQTDHGDAPRQTDATSLAISVLGGVSVGLLISRSQAVRRVARVIRGLRLPSRRRNSPGRAPLPVLPL